MLGRFGKDASSIVGVEIAPDAVRVVQLQRRSRRYRVLASAQEPFESAAGKDWVAEPDAVVAALRRAYLRSGLRQHRIALALPASQVICKRCHVPMEQVGAELETQLLADAERLFPFPLEDLALDFQVLGASGAQPGCAELMVAACRQSAWRHWMPSSRRPGCNWRPSRSTTLPCAACCPWAALKVRRCCGSKRTAQCFMTGSLAGLTSVVN